jgi:hypothetical protein
MSLKNRVREIKLSKLTNIVYVRRRNYHFNTLFYSLVALTLMIIENKYVVSIHVYLKIPPYLLSERILKTFNAGFKLQMQLLIKHIIWCFKIKSFRTGLIFLYFYNSFDGYFFKRGRFGYILAL